MTNGVVGRHRGVLSGVGEHESLDDDVDDAPSAPYVLAAVAAVAAVAAISAVALLAASLRSSDAQASAAEPSLA